MKKLCFFLPLLLIAFASCSPKLSPDSNWGSQRWVLIELRSVPVQLSGTRRDAFLEFSPAEKRFTGNGGCNRINGNYTLGGNNKISLSDIVSTKMSCNDINFETAFLDALAQVNRFDAEEQYLYLKRNGEIIAKLESRTRASNP